MTLRLALVLFVLSFGCSHRPQAEKEDAERQKLNLMLENDRNGKRPISEASRAKIEARLKELDNRASLRRLEVTVATRGDVIVIGRADSPGVVPGDNLPIPEAYTGIFSLQALTDFDCLDGVAIAPDRSSVSLFGHRSRKDRLYPIAYLDHLATAMECESPTLDLRWAPGSERDVERALTVDDKYLIDRLGTMFDGQGRLLPLGAWWFRLGGADAKEGMTRYQVNAAALRAIGRPSDATALLIIEKRDECLAKNDSDGAMAFFKLLCKQFEIYDSMEDLYNQSQQGKLTETEYLDKGMYLYIGAIAKLFGQDAQHFKNQYYSTRERGLGPQEALDRTAAVIVSPENQKVWLRQIIFKELFRNLSEVHIPPASAHQILGMTPRVSVAFDHLPPRSLMARVAFEADVFGKLLMVMPDLKKKIPRYRTYFEWRRTAGGPASENEGHLWFSPDGFELKESADRTVLHFGRTPVRINLHRKVLGKSVEDPALQQYADELTGLYDDIANEYPILHELRECMKMVAVADWLKKHQVRLSFPAEGRVLWNPPREIPGIVQIVIAVKEGPVGMLLWALGGVDFDGRYSNHGQLPGWKFSRNQEPVVALPRENMTVSPIQRTDLQVQTIRKKITYAEPPPPGTPMPGDPGWCGRANVGEKDRQRVESFMSLRAEGLDRRFNAREITAQRDKVLLLAGRIEHCDRMINAGTKARVDQMAELDDLKKAALEKQREIIEEFCWMGHDAVLDWDKDRIDNWGGATGAEWRKSKLVKAKDLLNEVRGKLQETLDAVEELRDQKLDGARVLKILEKVGDLTVKLSKILPEVEALGKAAEVAENTLPTVRLAIKIVGLIDKGTELTEMGLRISEINDNLGDKAKGQKGISKHCKESVDEFEREFRKLKEMVGGK